jgi:hypothetical protein
LQSSCCAASENVEARIVRARSAQRSEYCFDAGAEEHTPRDGRGWNVEAPHRKTHAVE